MREDELSFDDVMAMTRSRVLEAALPDVVFDGWSEAGLLAAIEKSGVPQANAKLAFPRGVFDLVSHFHRSGDARLNGEMSDIIETIQGIGPKVEACVLKRLEIASHNKEAVRKAASYFALPQNANQGLKLIWETSDHIWELVGIRDEGFSHYSRRASLSASYSATFLFWLQDDDQDMAQTRAFLKRRLEDQKTFGKFSGALKSKLGWNS